MQGFEILRSQSGETKGVYILGSRQKDQNCNFWGIIIIGKIFKVVIII